MSHEQHAAVVGKPALIMLALLVIALMFSAISVIYSTYRSRSLFAELETLKKSAAEMEVMWGQYLLEQSTWASHERVVSLAEQQVEMEAPDPKQVVMVRKIR